MIKLFSCLTKLCINSVTNHQIISFNTSFQTRNCFSQQYFACSGGIKNYFIFSVWKSVNITTYLKAIKLYFFSLVSPFYCSKNDGSFAMNFNLMRRWKTKNRGIFYLHTLLSILILFLKFSWEFFL